MCAYTVKMSLPKRILAGVLGCAAAIAHAGPSPVARLVTQPVTRVAFLSDPALPYVDHVVVEKSERRLFLMDGHKVVRSFRIHLGLEPNGPKERSGDYRTPQGWYTLVRRDPRSDYFLSIQICIMSASETAMQPSFQSSCR